MSVQYSFRKVGIDDVDMLTNWLAEPHVSAWWDAGPFDAAKLDDPLVMRMIVSVEGRPFAFMQDYDLDEGDHPFADVPDGTRGIDQYIGEPDMMGHGSAFIAARMAMLFDCSVPMIVTDPHPDNARAIAAYKKVGFVANGPVRDTACGAVLPMVAQPPKGV